MMSIRTLSFLPIPALALALGLCAGADDAGAQASGDNVMTRPVGSDAEPLKKERMATDGQPSETGDKAASTAGGEPATSSGLTVFERMGASLPDLPVEKDYKGPVDEAYGAFQRGYYLTAMQRALPRAQLGDPAAQTLVAEMMARGLGVKRSDKDAAFWYGQAADNGDPSAMFKYALLLMEGKDVQRDKAKADGLMQKAADAGNASAQFNHAQVLVADNPGEKGLKLALPYYEKSAEQGIADAQYAVAQLYMTIKDVPQAKRDTAREWLLRSARSGFDTAQLDIGVWLVNGVGGKRDVDAGFGWLRAAAYRGNVVAQNKLAHLYVNAIGTRPDSVEAAKWYVLSRRAGLKDPRLEDFYLGLSEADQKKAIDAANKFKGTS